MLLKLLLVSFLFAGASAAEAADLEAISRSPQWLRLYQSRSNLKSAITSDVFFFSPEGRTNLRLELEAAIQAYENPTLKFGREKREAACAFPARKLVLEKLLGRNFPQPKCAEFQEWKNRLNTDRASLVFVGAYPGNPASIFGHTFLRLSNSQREESGREGLDLLSYSVGFMARSDPSDPRSLYMLKGLMGYYPGYYELEPHYMKVGIYNNSESRDLWEVQLRLTREDVDLLTSYLWEVLFNAELSYYFIDENCSQKLIKFLEVIRPDLDISKRLALAVLPAETVRAVVEADFAEPRPKFRASIKRKLALKIERLSREERALFNRARQSLSETQKLQSPAVVSALLDHWLFENYAANANLPPEKAAIMDATYKRAAEVKIPPDETNEAIRVAEKLSPPFLGHRAKWIDLHGGVISEHAAGGLQYRTGVHPFWSNDPGYRDISAIEYLGFDLEFERDEDLKWKLLAINARSFENALGLDPKLSWMFEVSTGNECRICETNKPQIQLSGGVGGSWALQQNVVYLLAHAKSAAWWSDGAQALLAPGVLGGTKLDLGRVSLVLEGSHHWWRDLRSASVEARSTYRLDKDESVFVRARLEDLSVRGSGSGMSRTRNEWMLGWVQFFN